MSDPETVRVEEIQDQEDVQEELEKTAPPPDTDREDFPRWLSWTRVLLYGAAALILGALSAFIEQRGFPIRERAAERLAQAALAGALVACVLAIHRALVIVLFYRVRNRVVRYNLRRVLRLVGMLALAVVIASVYFANWYATAVSFGLVSLILGLALQAPITSFFGWIYILTRKPYRIGDRIKIGEARGDVIEVGYLDTTLWEFGGELLTSDHPSGRIIKFPNSQVFTLPVFNYSWPLFPYIWNEIKFQVAYESDLEFVAQTMKEVVDEDRGPLMAERIRAYRALLARTPIDQLQVNDQPTVFFRANDLTWLDAVVRYLVDPRRAGAVKGELIRKLLVRLNAAPDRVLFPKANAR